eukprot:COSAG02_NODE_6827_length_3340_cov_3.187905_6_plen_32_part_00
MTRTLLQNTNEQSKLLAKNLTDTRYMQMTAV